MLIKLDEISGADTYVNRLTFHVCKVGNTVVYYQKCKLLRNVNNGLTVKYFISIYLSNNDQIYVNMATLSFIVLSLVSLTHCKYSHCLKIPQKVTNIISGAIHKNLNYYETLHASELAHKVVKRGLQDSDHPFNKINEVSFRTLGRDFRLILTPKRGHSNVLHSKFKAYSVDADGKETTVHVDHDQFYDGRVFGESSSHASVHIDDGVLTGSISLPDETYHIEPSWRHLPHFDNKTMIAYKSSDVKISWANMDKTNSENVGPRTCGYVKEGPELEDREDEVDNVWMSSVNASHRQKRQVDQYEYTPTKTRCPLLLVADYRFFQEMGGSNTKTTINYLVSTF